MAICSVFFCLSFLTACGVFSVDADEVKSVSVMEGQSVTLYTDVVKHKDDLIVWSYGPENTVVAQINGKADSIMYSDDEMFRDRLKLNNQTGDLIITHITSQHSGLYTLRISRNMKRSYKTFNLTVNRSDIINSINKQSQEAQHLTTDASPKSSDSPPMWVIIISVVVPLVICMIIIIFIIFIKHRRMCHKETIYDPVIDKGSSIYSSSSEESNSSMSPNEPEKKHMMN